MNVNPQTPRILFIFINYTLGKFVGIDYHLGVGYIRAYLHERGVVSRQLICKEPITLAELVEKILAENIPVVGFTCYDTNYYFNKLVAQRLKRFNPTLRIIFGGPTATFSDELVLNDCEAVDICVRGEGEQTVYELLQVLRNGGELSSVEGISYRAGSRVVRNLDRLLIRGEKRGEELDVLPSPYLSGMIPLTEGADVSILTSRGCVYKCVYCNFSAMSRHTIRYHSVDRVIAELRAIDKATQGRRKLRIFDDLFPLEKNRAKEIALAIIGEQFRHLAFYCSSRADLVDEELLSLLRRAGFTGVRYGLESAIPRVLKNIRKVRALSQGDDFKAEEEFLEKVIRGVEIAKRIGFEDILVNIILGLPGETLEDAHKTIEFVRKLGVTEYAHNILQIYSGTELFHTYPRYNIRVERSTQELPYRTIHAFDVSKVLALSNAWQLRVADEYLWSWVETLCGASKLCYSETNRPPTHILFKGTAIASRYAFDWLAQFISFSTSISFVSSSIDENNHQHNLREITLANAPISSFDYFVPKRKGNRYSVLAFYGVFSEHIRNARRLFYLLPLADINRFLNGKAQTQARTVVFTITTDEDIVSLKEWGANISTPDKYTLPERFLIDRCFLLNECQWSERECPAAKLRTLVIDPEGQISPCVFGTSIGKVGDETTSLANALREFREAELKKRRCQDCPASSRCSKCLFPHPIGSSEYCRIRREHPEVSEVVRLLALARSFQKNLGASLRRSNCLLMQIKNPPNVANRNTLPRIRRNIMLASLDEQSFVCDIYMEKVYRLGIDAFHILQALGKQMQLDDIVAYLQAEYEISRQDAAYYVDKTIKSFQLSGFVQNKSRMKEEPR